VPAAGFCRQCDRYVWVSAQGECQFGHPASMVHSVYETPPAAIDASAPCSPSTAWATWVVAGAVVLGLVFASLAVYGIATWVASGRDTPVGSAVSVPDTWRARAAKDYPGWRVVGFESFELEESDDPPETDYVVRMVPPGRDFSVGVMYVSRQGREPYSTDDILRTAGPKHSLAPSLLDYLERNYVARDKIVEWVESESSGDAFVNWSPATSNDEGGFDELIFTVNDEWALAP